MKIFELDKTMYREEFHKAIFNESRGEDFDCALMVTDDKNFPMHYYAIRKISPKSAHVVYGGAMPDFRGKGLGFEIMDVVTDFLLKKFEVIKFCCKNTNKPMLKFGIHKDFKIIGLGISGNDILVEFQKGRI